MPYPCRDAGSFPTCTHGLPRSGEKIKPTALETLALFHPESAKLGLTDTLSRPRRKFCSRFAAAGEEGPDATKKWQRLKTLPFEPAVLVLLHRHADFGFVHCLVEVLERLRPMSLKIVFRALQFFLGGTHML